MSGIKEFANNKYRDYFEVSKGDQEVSLENFNDCYGILPDLDIFEENKLSTGRILLASLRLIEPQFVYYRREENSFIENPNEFTMRVLPGSDLENGLNYIKNIQSSINDMHGHYNVALYLLKFLLARNSIVVRKNKKLALMYEELLNEINNNQTKKEIKKYKVEELNISKKDEVLALMPEEKKLLSVNVLSEEDEEEDTNEEVAE